MTETVVTVFTYKAVEHMLQDGGSQAWKGNRKRLAKMRYVVCVRNLHGPYKPEGLEPHSHAFLVAKITGIVDADTDGQATKPDGSPRAKIAFTEYAVFDGPKIDLTSRFPVQYWKDLASIGINEGALEWHTAPPPVILTPMDRAKAMVAEAHGVTPDRVDITIRF